jgi:hypothetical protein
MRVHGVVAAVLDQAAGDQTQAHRLREKRDQKRARTATASAAIASTAVALPQRSLTVAALNAVSHGAATVRIPETGRCRCPTRGASGAG